MDYNDMPSPAFNDVYLSKVYMKPWFHFSSYVYGILMCQVYKTYLMERDQEGDSKSIGSNLLSLIIYNPIIRYVLYVAGIAGVVLMWMWQTAFYQPDDLKNGFHQSLYVALANPIVLISLCTLIMPAISGKCEFFRFLFCSSGWTMMSHQALGMFYISPFICLFYFLSIEHQIHIEYYIMFYYFAGNLLFSFTAWMLFGLFFERPLNALLNISDELELSSRSSFNIMRFVSKVFGNQLGM
jgi:hypothetical protein